MNLPNEPPPEKIIPFSPKILKRKITGCLFMFLRNYKLEWKMFEHGDPWTRGIKNFKIYACHQAVE